jgi:hypothetical protein
MNWRLTWRICLSLPIWRRARTSSRSESIGWITLERLPLPGVADNALDLMTVTIEQ